MNVGKVSIFYLRIYYICIYSSVLEMRFRMRKAINVKRKVNKWLKICKLSEVYTEKTIKLEEKLYFWNFLFQTNGRWHSFIYIEDFWRKSIELKKIQQNILKTDLHRNLTIWDRFNKKNFILNFRFYPSYVHICQSTWFWRSNVLFYIVHENWRI